MPTKNYEQVKIWKSAHAYIKQVSEAYKAQGISSMSMTALLSQACFSIPMPNGHTVATTVTNDEPGSVPTNEVNP